MIKKNKQDEKDIAIIEQSLIRDIIEDIYNTCLNIKPQARNKKQTIKIELQNINFPIDIKLKTKILDKLIKNKIINSYDLAQEKINSAPQVTEIPNNILGLHAPLTDDEYSQLSKHSIVIDDSNDSDIITNYIANIQCYPQKIIKCFQKNCENLKKEKKILERKQKILASLTVEQTLSCKNLHTEEELKFGLETGDAVYGDAITNFVAKGEEYKLLKTLMEKKNKRCGYQEISKILYGPERWNSSLEAKNPNSNMIRGISFLIRNIKRKLNIIGNEAKNKDLFFCSNGYGIHCDLKQ